VKRFMVSNFFIVKGKGRGRGSGDSCTTVDVHFNSTRRSNLSQCHNKI